MSKRSKKWSGARAVKFGLLSLGCSLALGMSHAQADDSIHNSELDALTERARWASMQVLQTLAEARNARRAEQAACLNDNLTQINSVVRLLQNPTPSLPISHLSERVTFLMAQAHACTNNDGSDQFTDGRTRIVMLVNPAPPSGEPRSLDELRRRAR